jgi:hypothetical protein
MDIKKIIEEIENSAEVKNEAKRIINIFAKGPGKNISIIMLNMLTLRMSGMTQEEILQVAAVIMCKLMRLNGISDDEMMEYIRKYK